MLQVTPVGIAIGIGVGSSYRPNSKIALGFEGAFNSVSAGAPLPLLSSRPGTPETNVLTSTHYTTFSGIASGCGV